MAVYQTNVDFANCLQLEEDVQKNDGEQDQQEHQRSIKEVPEEELHGILHMLYSEESVSLPEHETQEPRFEFAPYQNDIYSKDSDNSSSPYNGISTSSPSPTINDCIAPSDLHYQKNMDDTCNNTQLRIPIVRESLEVTFEDGLATKAPGTPEICDMIVDWMDSSDVNQLGDPKFENLPSGALSYVSEEPSTHATPLPSESSSTLYSPKPSLPAGSVYGNGCSSTRKPRGRTPKQHSDLPDPSVLRKLPESERKRYEDRCRNNEASRQTRRKNKERQMILIAEEKRLQDRKKELNQQLKAFNKTHRKLQKALHYSLSMVNV